MKSGCRPCPAGSRARSRDYGAGCLNAGFASLALAKLRIVFVCSRPNRLCVCTVRGEMKAMGDVLVDKSR